MKTLLLAAGTTLLSFAAAFALASASGSRTSAPSMSAEPAMSPFEIQVNEIADKEGGDSAFNYIMSVYDADTTRMDAAAMLAQIYFSGGNNYDALDWIDHVLWNVKDDKDRADAQALKANILYSDGVNVLNVYGIYPPQFTEAFPFAENAYRFYAARNEFNAEAFSVYATLLWREDSIDRAIPIFEEVIAGTPDHYSGYCGLSHCYRDVGNVLKAREIIDEGLERCEDKGYLYFNRAQLCEALKEYDEAIEAGISAIDLGIGMTENVMDRIAEEDGMSGKVIDRIDARIPGAGNPGSLSLLKARLYYRTGDRTKALEMADKSISLEPDNSSVFLSAIYFYESAGLDADKTVSLCDRYLKAFPDNADAQEVEEIKYRILNPEEVEEAEEEDAGNEAV